MSEKGKKLFWKMWQDRESMKEARVFVVLTCQDKVDEVDYFLDPDDDHELPPVFEPVEMTQAEFDALPEFEGF